MMPFKISDTFNSKDHGAMIFVIIKMVLPDTCNGCSDIKTKIDTMKISQLNHDKSKANLHISEWVNDISIDRETY